MSPTEISWCDETWNPTVGCSEVSPGCDNCYAVRVAARHLTASHYSLTTVPKRLPGGKATQPKWTGEVRCLPDRLDTPLHWRKPRRVFVDSMSDLFHPDVPEEFISDVFAVMASCPQHTFQVLTKRPQRMSTMLREWEDAGSRLAALPNVWLGVSVENQLYADLRIPHLLATPAAVRFLSCEPLLGPIDLDLLTLKAEGVELYTRAEYIRWVIVGGESGPGARPMHPEWARQLRDQCVAAEVPFHFKQWGEHAPDIPRPGSGQTVTGAGDGLVMRRVGKKAAGRELDGRTWDNYPETVHA